MLIILKQQEMSLLSYLYLKLSARQWWVFVFIGSADTLYLEKGAKRCHECMRSGEYFTISKCMMVWQATGFHFKIYAFILEKECFSLQDKSACENEMFLQRRNCCVSWAYYFQVLVLTLLKKSWCGVTKTLKGFGGHHRWCKTAGFGSPSADGYHHLYHQHL